MTTKEQLNKRAEEHKFEARMIEAYAEIVDLLEQRRRNWYSKTLTFNYDGETETEYPDEDVAIEGSEAEFEAYSKAIESILKLAK